LSYAPSLILLPVLAAGLLSVACGPAPPTGQATPVYNRTTGRLEQLVSDADANGTPDARAYMDGVALQRIELDRNQDGKPDRWEHYAPSAAGASVGTPPAIVRAEEANGADARVTRTESYKDGVLARVEEDTDLDGRVDKWETYEDGELRFVDLDLEGQGVATQRLVYATDGSATIGSLPQSETR
jgi:hypothetical protein